MSLYTSVMLSELLSYNYRINKAPNIHSSLLVLLTLSICLFCQSVYPCPFTFTLPLILTVMISGIISCVYFLSITRSSTELSYNLDRGSSQNLKKKPTGILYLLQFILNCCTGYILKLEIETFWYSVLPLNSKQSLNRVSQTGTK